MRLIRPLTILLCVLLLTAAVPERRTTIFVIGDSTAANKDISGGKQERGWAMALQSYFDDNIFVDNHAVNGRSSKSFHHAPADKGCTPGLSLEFRIDIPPVFCVIAITCIGRFIIQ